MKRIIYYSSLLLMQVFFTLSAQEKLKVYDRASVSYMILNTPEKESFEIFKETYLKVEPSPKFDVNRINNRVVSVPSGTTNYEDAILEQLNNSNIGQEILSSWVSFDEKGTMSTARFMERGLYNASDEDVIKAMAMKRGLAYVQDYGENLIQKSYVMVVALEKVYKQDKVSSWDQIKALFHGKLKMRTNRKGYYLKIKAYLYKIDFNEERQAEFYKDCWINEDDPEDVKKGKIEAYKNFHVGFKFIAANEVTNFKFKGHPPFPINIFVKGPSFEKIMTSLVEKNYEKNLRSFDKQVEDLQVKVPVYNVKPVQAKVGKKEDLRINQRYFAYEYTIESNNEIKMKHVGVVRAKRPTDNRHIASGNMKPSRFAQVWGKVEPGMLLVQKPDVGLNVSGGYQFGKYNEGLFWQVDYLLGRRAKWFPISNLYISLQLIKTKYKIYDQTQKEDISFISLQKPICIAQNLKLTPYLGTAGIVLNTGETDLAAGIKLSWSIRHNIQIGAYGTYFNFYDRTAKGYPDRNGLNYGLNVQISL
jgi:hypothetical protein